MEVTNPSENMDVIATLAELPDTAIVSEEALCRIFARSSDSIKRAVHRGELPPPVRLLASPHGPFACWFNSLKNDWSKQLWMLLRSD
jgi:hypothetical protein